MDKLKECPFCGHVAQVSRIPNGGLSVLCTGCGAIAVLDGSNVRDALAAAWNRRTVRPNFNRTDKIKPCPFCASRQDVTKLANNNSIIACMSCRMMISFVHSSNLPASIAYWNRRAGE